MILAENSAPVSASKPVAKTRVSSSISVPLRKTTPFGAIRSMKLDGNHLSELRHAYRRGKAASFLPTFRWEEHWTTPVSELRTMLACPA